jgi:hypothetical protein
MNRGIFLSGYGIVYGCGFKNQQPHPKGLVFSKDIYYKPE